MIVLKPKGNKQRIEVLQFSPSGRELFAAGNGSWLDLWYLDPPMTTVRRYQASSIEASIFDATFFAEGQVVLMACGAEGLRCITVASTSSYTEAVFPGLGWLNSLSVSPDERHVLGFNPAYPVNAFPGQGGFQLWGATNGVLLRQLWTVPLEGWCRGITFLPDGKRFAACVLTGQGTQQQNAQLVVRELREGDIISVHSCPYLLVEQLLLSPEGDLLLARSGMGLVIWPADDFSGSPRKVLNDNRKHFTAVAFHPSGRFLAATSNDATVKLYDTTTWELAKTFTWDIGRMRSIAFSPDGTLAAAGSDSGKVVVWDVDV